MAPAAPTLLPSPPPITGRIALGALTSTFPPGLVDRVIEQTGRAEQLTVAARPGGRLLRVGVGAV